MTKSTNQNANKLVQRQIKDLQKKSNLLANEDSPGLETAKQYIEHQEMLAGYNAIFSKRIGLSGVNISSLGPGFYSIIDPPDNPEKLNGGGIWDVDISLGSNGGDITYYARSEYSNTSYIKHVRANGSNTDHTITEWQRIVTETPLWSGSAGNVGQKLTLLEDFSHYSAIKINFKVFNAVHTAVSGRYNDKNMLFPWGTFRVFGGNLNDNSATTDQYADLTESEIKLDSNTLTISAINHFSLNLSGVTANLDNDNTGFSIADVIGIN